MALDSEVLIHFDKPVDRRHLHIAIEPEIDGVWTYENPLLGNHFFRTLRFTPHRVLQPDTTYTITLEGITDLLALGSTQSWQQGFRTRDLPGVAQVSPNDESEALSANAPVQIMLSRPAPDYAQYYFRLTPATEFHIQQNAELNTYALIPESSWAQGSTYHLTVERVFVTQDLLTGHVLEQSEATEVYSGNFAIAPPPSISSLSPTGEQVAIDTKPSFTFTQAMDSESVRAHFSITPEINGTIESEDNATFTFVPETAFAYDTSYTFEITKGAATADGGFLTENTSFSFGTIGPVRVSYLTPDTNAQGISTSAGIKVVFDQEVEHASAEQAFQITPDISGSFAWDGNAMTYQPSERLAYSTGYTVSMRAGIQGLGPDSVDTYVSSFTTAAQTVQLAVASDLQDKPLSCEAAALKMALANKGVSVSESDIMSRVGYDSTPHTGNVWGDPYLAFVGDINGRQNTTGYGVYWNPIAAAANAWRPSEAFTGWSIQQLTQEVQNGNAVVVWGVYGNGYRDDWVTPEGKTIYAWKGEHARTVIGFVGSAENPERIILNDPYAGRVSWTRAQFERDWGIFTNSGVVVR